MSLLWKIKVLKKRFLDTDCTDCTVDFSSIKSRHIDFTNTPFRLWGGRA